MRYGEGERLLTINTGSSSIKAALYRDGGSLHMDLTARIDRIGLANCRIHVEAGGRVLLDEPRDLADHHHGIEALFAWIKDQGYASGLAGIGHRVVHGGPGYAEPQIITPALVAALERLIPIDPDHLPQALDAIRAAAQMFPGVPQVACFDTAFHRHMPRVAQVYALPYRYAEEGVLRYGFHGLSYEYIMDRMAQIDPQAARGRIVIAHLGNGSSMAAVRDGVGIETTMGFTPAGGLVMGTRPGDLDPGVLLYLLQVRDMDPAALNHLINKEAGLLGVSGSSADMQDLLAARRNDPRAALAVDLYCYQARKFLGALAAALGGLDMLVFTAGIGEHASAVRAQICAGLEFLGIEIDPRRNAGDEPIISRAESTTTVRVMPADEDLMIARHTRSVLEERGDQHVHV